MWGFGSTQAGILVLLGVVLTADGQLTAPAPAPTGLVACGADCQSAQRAALESVLGMAYGPGYRPDQVDAQGMVTDSVLEPPVPLTEGPPPPPRSFNPPNSSWPEHCDWHSVHCCTLSGILDGRNGFPSQESVPCRIAGGVIAIVAPSTLFNGSLASGVWSAFSETLQVLDMAENNLTGTLPEDIATLTSLTYLRLERNRLSGPIPSSYASMSRLSGLRLGNNALNGTLPMLTRLGNLAAFSAGSNHFTGTVPRDWSFPSLLETFSVENNQLTGTFPPPVNGNLYGEHHVGMTLNIRNNHLTGTIPTELRFLPLARIDMGANRFVGNLAFLLSMPYLVEIHLDGNMHTGHIPPVLSGPLQIADLSNNMLTGSMPPLDCPGMNTVRISSNNLSGPLPATFIGAGIASLRVHASGLQQKPPMPQNAFGQNLPPWLAFDNTTLTSSTDVTNMLCPTVVANSAGLPLLKTILLDSYYYNYQYCVCRTSFTLQRSAIGTVHCLHAPKPNTDVIITCVIIGVLVALLASLGSAVWLYRSRHMQTASYKRAGPPGLNKPLTLVMTDVEGSTELWEWDRVVMMEAITLHDRIMRASLAKFFGHEVGTEGDAFTMAFHDPLDATAWCTATQQALLAARWPRRLEEHARTRIRLYSPWATPQGATGEHAGSPDFLSLKQVDPRQILFWGLNVRMAIVHGECEGRTQNNTSKAVEYKGKVAELVKGMLDVPHGGQIIMDGRAFQGIKAELTTLAAMTPPHPDYDAIERQRRELGYSSGPVSNSNTARQSRIRSMSVNPQDFSSTTGQGDDAAAVILSLLTSRVEEENSTVGTLGGSEGESRDPLGGTGGQYTSRLLDTSLVRNTSSMGSQSSPLPLLRNGKAYSSDSRRQMNAGDYFSRGQDYVSRGRGSVLQLHSNLKAAAASSAMSASDWAARAKRRLTGRKAAASEGTAAGLTILDMGQHMLPKVRGSHLIVQVLVPGLEERARTTAPLGSVAMSPGYFDAPGAPQCPLLHLPMEPLPPVTIVFCALEGVPAMKEANSTATDLALLLYKDYVRRWLLKLHGYECQEAEGEFMLAFFNPIPAIQFCLQVQDAMMQGMWVDDVLALPGCGAELGQNSQVVWFGPRVRMGLFDGEPVRVLPHATSGRADYFGPVINRAARFCHSGAYGGQITLPIHMARQLVREWTGQDVALDIPGPPATLQHHGLFWGAGTNPQTSQIWEGGSQVLGSASVPRAGKSDAGGNGGVFTPGLPPFGMGWNARRSVSGGNPAAMGDVPTATRGTRSMDQGHQRNGFQTRPNPALRKSNSLGSLPNHSAVDEHADHACGMQLDPSPPTNRSKSLHTLPLEQLRADYFGKRLEAEASMTSMHSYRHQPAAACIGGALVAGGEALAARPVFRKLHSTGHGQRRATESLQHRSRGASSCQASFFGMNALFPPSTKCEKPAFDDMEELEMRSASAPALGWSLKCQKGRTGDEAGPSVARLKEASEAPSRASMPGVRLSRTSSLISAGQEPGRPISAGSSAGEDTATQASCPGTAEIQIHHRGVYHFKGLAEPIALMQINSATLAGRCFPDTACSRKAKQLAEPLGLKCTVILPAQLLHAPTNQA